MAEYMSDEERLSRLRDWWSRNGAATVVGVVLAIVVVLGWRWYQGYADEQLTSAADAYAAYQSALGDEQRRLGDAIVAEHAGTAYPTFVLLAQAQAAVRGEDLAAAETALQKAVTLATGPELADIARLRLARVQQAAKRGADALTTLEQVRSVGMLSVARELAGDIHLAEGDRKQAHEAYAAALKDLKTEDQRGLLEAKLADTADAADA
ncbi:MAG: YfgM family protein [Pseudomonadales bacterium]